ncbi:hypothetical protein [Okeania sp. SIO2B3]|nr:hypothetical protein [Okeania sp. SIO2B3]
MTKESGVSPQESGGKKEEERESFFITNYPDMRQVKLNRKSL